MTYDPASGNPRDRVRMLIGDRGAGLTPTKPEVFLDDEVDLALTMAGATDDAGVHTAAALLLTALANDRARLAIQWSVMAQEASIDQRSVARECRLQAERMFALADQYATGDTATWSDASIDDLLDSLTQAGLLDLQHAEDRTNATTS